MKPLNQFFNVVWHILGPLVRILHPLEVSGLENLPPNGALLCANHSSNWDPILIGITTPVNYLSLIHI